MTRAVRVRAHAKINVRLKVLERMDDGYHALETVFVRIGLADHVSVSVDAAESRVDVAGLAELAAEIAGENLAAAAVAAFTDATGWSPTVGVDIGKEIPIGAGLGGGSADAAAVLLALNELAPEPLARDELLNVAARLGADVPFMASGLSAAIGRGRGDELTPLRELEERPVVLLTPPFSVSTKDAYAWLDADRAAAPPTAAPLTAPANWATLASVAENDLEAPVVARHPEVAAAIALLRDAGAEIARMSGSGSTVYGVYPAGANPVVEGVPERWQVRVTQTLRSVVRPAPIE